MLPRNPSPATLLAFTLAVFVPAVQTSATNPARRPATIAVFPVENLSGGPIPADQVRRFLIGTLVSDGVRVLETGALDQFFDRHRVRYTGGIDAPTAEALRAETGADAVVIASVEQYSTGIPPKVALSARLVAIDGPPTVVWADDVGMAGDEAPGLFDLGVVRDYSKLEARAFRRLADSLRAHVKTGEARPPKADAKFRPGTIYSAIAMEKGRTYSVAVIPFLNLTDRGGAGDIVGLMFVRHLAMFPAFRVIDSGVVRRQLLDARIIMDGGLSLSDADTVASLVDADFVVGGRVLRYDGSAGAATAVLVEFSTVLVERKSRKVVWSSDSYNEGREGVGILERGAPRTAHAMATQMVRLTAAAIAGRDRRK